MDRLIKLEELDHILHNFEYCLDYMLLEKSKMEASGDDEKFFNLDVNYKLDAQIKEMREKIKTFNTLAELCIKKYPIFIDDNISIISDYDASTL